MCRIAGILQPGQEQLLTEQRVKEMCRLQKHGGPDDEGLYSETDSGLVLGNRRLALIDLSAAGHMPMKYEDRYVITYNGELYNYLSLKEELTGLGHRFNNHTDTEVILAAFAQWKSQSFVYLKGMFAFALWDTVDKELYLVRDPAGIKPLYYSSLSGTIVFASEVRAFTAAGQVYTEDKSWPVMQMAYGHLPEPITTLNEVKPLPKGCFLHYCLHTQKCQLQSFNHYSYSRRISEPAASNHLKTVMQEAVSSHMMADAPVGVFLSGGLDSSIIAMLAAKKSLKALHTLSIYFKDGRFSEKKYQDIIIDQLQCNHKQYLLQEDDFLAAFPAVLDAMDLPSCDGVNTWFISKYAAANGLKAVLSGIGGDELFGGYPSFKRMATANLLQQLPNFAISQGKHGASKKLNRMSYLQLAGIKGSYLFLRGHFTPHEIARHLEMDEQEVWTILSDSPLLLDVGQLDPKNKASWMEFNLYMQNQLLRDADVMSMQNGIEIRVPFLDEAVVKLAHRMQTTAKYPGPLPKQLLINCFKNDLPVDIYNRPKMGFGFPFDDWLTKSELVKDLMAGGNGAVQKTYAAFMKGRIPWYQLMALILQLRRR